MARITIIETGHVPKKYREHHGSFPDMFARMVRAADPSAAFDIVSIPDGEALPDPRQLDAILITGAAAGVYDGLDWIAPLEEFVRTAHANRTPMVGVCFGHQLIAQAFGGTVRKSDKGWGIGRHVYQVTPDNGVVDGEALAIACSHQDQVIEAPSDARTIMSSDFATSRRMPACSTPTARPYRCSRTPNSTWRSPKSAARCAKATHRMLSWLRPELRSPSRWTAQSSAARSQGF